VVFIINEPLVNAGFSGSIKRPNHLDDRIRWILSDKSSHLRCWRLRSANQLPTGLMLSGAPGPHLQMQAASRLKLKRATHNNRGIDNFKTNNTSNTLIVLSKIVIILFRIL
jgi:hypothetical protein